MSDIQRGFTFTTTVTATDLHNLVDNATILPGFISAKSSATPVDADEFLFYQSSSTSLKQITFSGLKQAFPRNGPATQYALRQLGTITGTAAAGDDSRFPTQDFTAIRKANANAADTAATPADMDFNSLNLAGGTVIDWAASDFFYDTLSADKTYTFLHLPQLPTFSTGRSIVVALQVGSHNVTWPTLFGAAPALTPGATVHYFTFIKTPLSLYASGVVVAL